MKELVEHLKYKIDSYSINDEDLKVGIAKRTIERDLKDIKGLFNVNIDYSRENKGYFISNDNTDNMNFQRMIEAFELFNSLNIADDLSTHVFPEKRRPLGTEHIYGIIHSIKNSFRIRFSYQKYWEDFPTHREVEPYALKEFRSRWYVIAKDLNNKVKTFGLDRISDLEITRQKFERTLDYDVNESFRNCFGIFNPEELKAEEIILSFDPVQGRYIKSFPLHESQKVLIDNEAEIKISIKVIGIGV